MPRFVAQVARGGKETYVVVGNPALATEAEARAHAGRWRGETAALDPVPSPGELRSTVVLEAADRGAAREECLPLMRRPSD